MKKHDARLIQPNRATLILLILSIVLNYLGGEIALAFKMPIWLDCTGTFIAGCLAGPGVGALSGVMSSFARGILSPVECIYSITSGMVGFTVGFMARRRLLDRAEKIIICGIVLGVVAAVVSTPINMVLWGGQSGNAYNDFLFSMNVSLGVPVFLASLANGIVVDISDKMITLLLALVISRNLPDNIIDCFLSGQTPDDGQKDV